MKYIISRTSHRGNDKIPPCPEAIKEQGEWIIEINSLEELEGFVRTYGAIVIEKWSGSNRLDLEIYDDYRE